jgi:hypothetical protein
MKFIFINPPRSIGRNNIWTTDAVQKAYHRAYRKCYLRPSHILRRLISLRTREEAITYAMLF